MFLPTIAQQVCLDKPDLTAINMPGDCFAAPCTEGVDDKHFVALRNERVNQMGADEPGPACHHIKHQYLLCNPCYKITAMFIGIDHGTTAMRFASETGQFKLTREEARGFSIADFPRLCPPDEIEGIALCDPMGDNFSKITDINKKKPGVISREGAESTSAGEQGL